MISSQLVISSADARKSWRAQIQPSNNFLVTILFFLGSRATIKNRDGENLGCWGR